jgi:hypothetical protein
VRGLNIALATVAIPLAALMIARALLRKGSTASAKGSGRLLAQAISTARAAGVRGRILFTDLDPAGHSHPSCGHLVTDAVSLSQSLQLPSVDGMGSA